MMCYYRESRRKSPVAYQGSSNSELYMLGAKYGLAQSMDYAAPIMDSYFACQSWIRTLRDNPWIRTLRDNPWIARAIHGSRESKGTKYKFVDNPWIELRAQTTDRLVCSQVQSKGKLQVSGIALPS